MNSNIVKAARAALDMTQETFGVWLAGKTGRAEPFPVSRISEWEYGKRSPRKNVRDACLSVVAGEIASDAVLKVCQVFWGEGIDPLIVAMSDDALAVKDEIKNRIIAETS